MSNSQDVESFSLKLAKNQSAVCLMPVKMTVAKSEMYIWTCPSKRIMRTRCRVRAVRDVRKALRAAADACNRKRRLVKCTVEVLRIVSSPRAAKSAEVREDLRSLNLGSKVGVVAFLASPERY